MSYKALFGGVIVQVSNQHSAAKRKIELHREAYRNPAIVSKKNRVSTNHDEGPGLARRDSIISIDKANTRLSRFAARQRILTTRSLPASLIKIKLKKLTKMMTRPPLTNHSALLVRLLKNKGVRQI